MRPYPQPFVMIPERDCNWTGAPPGSSEEAGSLDSGCRRASHAPSDAGADLDEIVELIDDSDRDSQPPESYAPGQLLAQRYQLVRRIGHGGMGSVWVAHHMELDSQVAIKLLRPDVRDDAIIERFLNEGRILARLDHPAIVRVLDFGHTEHDDPFLVMELLNGESLYYRLYRHIRFSAIEAVQMLLPVAAALAAAHAKQVVHRDLKPDNIFLAEVDGARLQPKLLDFGVARSLRAKRSSRLTRTGGVVGSPEYMAPEQAAGESDIDHRADIWGFCAVLYECVTGQRLYRMEDSYERVLRQIIDDPVTPMSDWGVDEPELWKIIRRGLQKNREERWQTIEELGGALVRWLSRRGVTGDVSGTAIHTLFARTEPLPDIPTMSTAPAVIPLRSRLSRLLPTGFSKSVAAGLAIGLGFGALGLSVAPSPNAAAAAASPVVSFRGEESAAQEPLALDPTEEIVVAAVDGEEPSGKPLDPSNDSVSEVAESAAAARARSHGPDATERKRVAHEPSSSTRTVQEKDEARENGEQSSDREVTAPKARVRIISSEPIPARGAAAESSVEVFYADLGF